MAKLLQENKDSEVVIRENSFTMVLDINGKLYSVGGLLGDKLSTDTPDEDLDSALRAINGASITLQRTLAVKIADRDESYKLPGDTVEQDLTPLVDKIADVEIEKATEVKAEDPQQG
jgi:hypothetical protein